MPRLDVSVATAGHVDHGKSTLIRVLTGTDPDRLPEEGLREMTIELGFASLARPDGGRVAFIDVPGHERLIETMVAGVASIDAALLVVAADDGPMPQTIEHLRILRLLNIRDMVVALTRTDLVDEEWLRLATTATRDLLDQHGYSAVPIIPVSSFTGEGLTHLSAWLLALTPRVRLARADDTVWMPVDRAFHRPGFGTIVAGTLTRGQLRRGEIIEIWPRGLRATVRHLESHSQTVDSVRAGQRVGINLAGIGLEQVSRGNVISDTPVPAIETVDILFEPADPEGPFPRSGDLIRLMVGTDRVDASIQLLELTGDSEPKQRIARLRFRRPVATGVGDRVIVRRPSPAATLGGGVVLARYAGRPPRIDSNRRVELVALAVGNPEPALRRRLAVEPISIEQAIADLTQNAEDVLRRWLRDGTIRALAPLKPPLGAPARSTRLIAEDVWLRFSRELGDELRTHHLESPEAPGAALTVIRSGSRFSGADFDDLVELTVRQGQVVRREGTVALRGYRPRLRESEREATERLLHRLEVQRGIELVAVDDYLPSTIYHLERNDAIVRVDVNRIMSARQFERVASWVIEASRSQALDLPTVRDQVRLGRDTVQRLLERMDQLGLTVRHGDGRRPGPAAAGWASARHERHYRRLGQVAIGESRHGGTSIETSPLGDGETVVHLITDDPVYLVTSGAAMFALTRMGRRVIQVHASRLHDRVPSKPDEAQLNAMADRAMADRQNEPGVGERVRFVDEVLADMEERNGTLPKSWVVAPLGLIDDPEAIPGGGIVRRLLERGHDVLSFEDQLPVHDGNAALAIRLGMLVIQGFHVHSTAITFLAEDLEAAVDAIMTDPGAVAALAHRYGLDQDRPAIRNLVAGYHRSLTDEGLTQRFWHLRRDSPSSDTKENRDQHAS